MTNNNEVIGKLSVKLTAGKCMSVPRPYVEVHFEGHEQRSDAVSTQSNKDIEFRSASFEFNVTDPTADILIFLFDDSNEETMFLTCLGEETIRLMCVGEETVMVWLTCLGEVTVWLTCLGEETIWIDTFAGGDVLCLGEKTVWSMCLGEEKDVIDVVEKCDVMDDVFERGDGMVDVFGEGDGVVDVFGRADGVALHVRGRRRRG
eukprot:gene29693-37011_t